MVFGGRFHEPEWTPVQLLPTEPFSTSMLKAAEECLDTDRQSLMLLHQAGQMEKCRYPVDVGDWKADYPHLGYFRRCSRALNMKACALLDKGETDGAVEAIEDICRLGESVKLEPDPKSQCLRLNAYMMTMPSVSRAIHRGKLTDAQLSRVSNALAQIEVSSGEALLRGDAGNCAKISLGAFPIGTQAATRVGCVSFIAYFLTGGFEKDQLTVLDLRRQFMGICKIPRQEREAAVAKFHDKRVWFGGPLGQLEQVSLGYITNVCMENECVAKIRAARTALAIQRYRLAHNNALPSRLDDLVPAFLDAVPTDPFGGKPLRYQQRPAGFVVYSVGRDGVDNGGKEYEFHGIPYWPGTDIPFTVYR